MILASPCRRLLACLFLLLVVGFAGLTAAAARSEFESRREALPANDAFAHFEFAIWCKQNRYFSEHRQLLEQVIAINSDHLLARKLLGFEQVDGQWLKGPDLKKAKGLVLYDGKWRPQEDAAKLAQGLIEHQGKWLTADEYHKARGDVRYLGKWVSKSRMRRIEKRNQRLQELTRLRADWEQAWSFKTKYFEVKTNTSHQIAEEMGLAMDDCFEALKQVFGLRKRVAMVPLEIYATQEQFQRGSAAAGIRVPTGVLGYFWWRGAERGIRCFYVGSLEKTLQTLYHECSHLVLRERTDGDIPTWSNEGLAVFFEDANRDEKGMDLLTVPWHRLWNLHAQLRASKGSISLRELVELPQQAYSGIYYPRGWSLIYYLLFADEGAYRKDFSRYFDLLVENRGRNNNTELFTKAFGKTPDQMQDGWLAFISALEPTTAKDFIGAALTASEGYLDINKATAYAEQAIEMEPKAWRAHAALGRVLLHGGMLERVRGEGAEASLYFAASIQAYRAAIEHGGLEKLRKKRGQSIHDQLQLYVDLSRAEIYAGDYEGAAERLEDVLEVDELSSPAYLAFALMATIAGDPSLRSFEEAETYLQLADDFGTTHRNLAARAELLAAQGKTAPALELLQRAAAEDRFGFGAHLYRLQAQHLSSRGTQPSK